MYTPFTDDADTPPPKRRVLIVDDHGFFAACLRTLLDAEPDLEVCEVLSSPDELGQRIDHLRPDLVLIDLALGGESGLQVGQRLRAMDVTVPILFMSTMRTLNACQLSSVSRAAFVAKSKSPSQFLAALRDTIEQRGNAVSMSVSRLAQPHAVEA